MGAAVLVRVMGAMSIGRLRIFPRDGVMSRGIRMRGRALRRGGGGGLLGLRMMVGIRLTVGGICVRRIINNNSINNSINNNNNNNNNNNFNSIDRGNNRIRHRIHPLYCTIRMRNLRIWTRRRLQLLT